MHTIAGEIPFSIASIPSTLPKLTLLYRSESGNPQAAAIDALCVAGTSWRLSLPYGRVRVDPRHAESLLLIVSGSAFAQAHSIVTALAEQGSAVRITLCRLVRRAMDVWVTEEMGAWQQQLPHLRSTNLVRADLAVGRHWFDVLAATVNLAPAGFDRAVLGGSLARVREAVLGLTALGWDGSRIAADALEYDRAVL